MSFASLKETAPGLLAVLTLALPAWLLGHAFPIIGGPVFAILLGMAVSGLKRPEALSPGIRFTSRKVLQGAIILLGFEMNLFTVLSVGGQSLQVMLFTLGAAFLTAWGIGRWLTLGGNEAVLIGVGTAICGGSAIAATAPVIGADDREVAYSISTIFLFNILAVFLFPAAGHLLGLGDTGFGVWAGTAINDTSSVVAAGYSYSDAAGNIATVVKLTRTLMIIPVTLVLGAVYARRHRKTAGFRLSRIFPWFVLGFLAAAVLNTTGILPPQTAQLLGKSGKFLIVMAMGAIGLNTHLGQLLRGSLRPMLLGLACWASVALTSLLVQHTLGLW